jgi:hypothetical protein
MNTSCARLPCLWQRQKGSSGGSGEAAGGVVGPGDEGGAAAAVAMRDGEDGEVGSGGRRLRRKPGRATGKSRVDLHKEQARGEL